MKRSPKPLTLHKNAEKWKRELMVAVRKYRRDGTTIPSKLKIRYKKQPVLDALKQMYSDPEGNALCCYCESEIEIVTYPHIEHRKPKDPDCFPEKTFTWTNLHLGCPKCNGHKGNQWNADYPILDAAVDNVSEHLDYVPKPAGVYRLTKSERGITTEKHADLNRDHLIKARQKILWSILKTIDLIKDNEEDPAMHTYKQILRDEAKGKFGSLIQWALEKGGIEE